VLETVLAAPVPSEVLGLAHLFTRRPSDCILAGYIFSMLRPGETKSASVVIRCGYKMSLHNQLQQERRTICNIALRFKTSASVGEP